MLHIEPEQMSPYYNYYKQVNTEEAVISHHVKSFCFADTGSELLGFKNKQFCGKMAK